MTLNEVINRLKKHYAVDMSKSFTLPFKLDGDKLFVKYNDKWYSLMHKNGAFYNKASLRRMYKAPLMNALFKNLRDANSEDLIAFSDDVKLPPQPPEKERSILDEPILEAETYTILQ